MSDSEPKMNLNLGGKEVVATPHNTELYHFLGSLAMYNHLFVYEGEQGDEGTYGSYAFAMGEDWFDRASAYMVAEGYPMHVNLMRVPKCDVDSYNKAIDAQIQDMTDHIPEDWLDGEA